MQHALICVFYKYCTIFSWLQKQYMLIMESLESIEKQKKRKKEIEIKEGRGNGRKEKGRREDGKDRWRKERERKKKNKRRERKNSTSHFSQYFHVHSFQCILYNLIKNSHTVGWMYSFIVYFFLLSSIMNKTYPMPLISYLSV